MLKPQDNSDLGTTLSRIWTFVFFVMVFRDLHELATAQTINEILDGQLGGNPVTDTGLVVGGLVLVIMLLTSLLSTLLTAKVTRRLNLTVAPIALLGLFYLPPNDPDDYLLGGVSATALLVIIGICWFWQPEANHISRNGAHHAI